MFVCFSFSASKMLLHWLLLNVVSEEKSAVILIFVPLWNVPYLLAAFNIVFLSLVLSNFIMMYFVVLFFCPLNFLFIEILGFMFYSFH